MAQLWGGRFTKETDQLVYNFNASISFDQKFYKQDIQGSIAHVSMLGKQGILTEKEMQDIITCLKEIEADVESGKLEMIVWEIPERSYIRDEAEMIRWHWICVYIPDCRYLKQTNFLKNFYRYFFVL